MLPVIFTAVKIYVMIVKVVTSCSGWLPAFRRELVASVLYPEGRSLKVFEVHRKIKCLEQEI
jgi:hypothetical protein